MGGVSRQICEYTHKKHCEYIVLEKKNLATLYLTGLTWVMYRGIMSYMFTWAQTSVKFALGVYWAIKTLFSISVSTQLGKFYPPPHNLNLPSGVCESFTLIIMSDVWHLFFYLTLKKKSVLSLPQADFFPVRLETKMVLSFNCKDFYCQSRSQYL